MQPFIEGLIAVIADIPINIHECGVSCAAADLLSYVLWALNGKQALDCANAAISLILGPCISN